MSISIPFYDLHSALAVWLAHRSFLYPSSPNAWAHVSMSSVPWNSSWSARYVVGISTCSPD